MSIRKCAQCGLVAFSADVVCRRCGTDLAAGGHEGPAAGLKPTAVRPTVFGIIKTDYLALLAILFPVIGIALYIATGVFGLHLFRYDKTSRMLRSSCGWRSSRRRSACRSCFGA